MVVWVLSGICACTAVSAANVAAYQAIRNNVRVTGAPDLDGFLKELPYKVGQVIEIDGVVTGIIANNTGSAFMLRTAGGQTLLFSTRTDDPDVDVTVPIRVLTRVPVGTTMLECLAATPLGPALAVSPIAADAADPAVVPGHAVVPAAAYSAPQTGITSGGMPVEVRPPVIYSAAPERLNDLQQQMQLDYTVNPEYVQAYADRIQACNPRIDQDTTAHIAASLLTKCRLYGVDPRLMFALVAQESRFNPRAVSHSGACGLGQLMPGTAASLGVRDSFDIDDNLDGAVRYLATQLNTFGQLSLALAAYNAGPGSVKRYGGVPPYDETQNYVRIIWNHYCSLIGLDPQTGEPVASR